MTTAPSVRRLRVALVNDFQHIVELLQIALEAFSAQLEVVELDVRDNPHHDVDIALFDTFGQAGWGIGRLRQLQVDPHVGAAVVHASLLTPEQCELFMAAGAGAIVAKHHPVADLVDVLVAVSRGDVVVQALVRRPRRPAWPGSGLGLTERQSEVASLLAADLSFAAISSALLIQVGTVRQYVRTVLGKLGVDSVGGAVRRLSDDAEFRRSNIASRWRTVGV